MHALKAVELATAGRGKKGGLAEYARQIGKTPAYITQIRNAAEVLQSVKSLTQVNDLLDKAKHLSAIHAADQALWPLLVETMLEKQKEDTHQGEGGRKG